MREPFAWIAVDYGTVPVTPLLQPRNMKAFLPTGLRVDSLGHNTYRFIRKADISITAPDFEHILGKFKTGDNIRIRSNGICFEVEKE